MVLLSTPPIGDEKLQASNFSLPSVIDNKTYSLQDIQGENGTLIMFICNHCPYVRAIIDKLVIDIGKMQELGIGVCAIMSNDYKEYPDDSPENMREFARKHNFPFPYLLDEMQVIAKNYNAACTPDFFGFNKKLELCYRGRFNEGGKEQNVINPKHNLLEAMQLIVKNNVGPEHQYPSIGCSIKWKRA